MWLLPHLHIHAADSSLPTVPPSAWGDPVPPPPLSYQLEKCYMVFTRGKAVFQAVIVLFEQSLES